MSRPRRLAIPRRLLIRGQEWRVRVARKVPSHGSENIGLTDYAARTIWLARKLNGDHRGEVFVHELLHALAGEYADDADKERDEAVILKLEASLHALLLSGQIVSVPTEEVP